MDIEKLAREAGLSAFCKSIQSGNTSTSELVRLDAFYVDVLRHFAALVAEEAAKVCDELDCQRGELSGLNALEAYDEAATQCAEAIRARFKPWRLT